jgi:hypothetical protein
MNEQQQKAAQALFETYDQRVQDTSLTVEAAWSNKLAGEAVIKRQGLLQDSDWTQLKDVPGDNSSWATYRQALRDITDQENYPLIIDWPKAPTDN